MTVPEGLQERGRALWSALGQTLDSPAGAIALEACRTVDRLDELASVIEGKGVLNLMSFRLSLDLEDEVGDRQVHVKVEFSNVLAEARQQSLALKQLLTTLGIDKQAGGQGGDSPLAAVLELVAGQSGAKSPRRSSKPRKRPT